MTPHWRSFLESADAVFDGEEVVSFGDTGKELEAARTRTVVVPLSHLSCLEAVGDDAQSFLHNQFTSDINHLLPGHAQYSAWCSAKGRMQVSFVAWRAGEAFRLALAADLEGPILKRLQMFVLRARVKLSSLADTHVLIGIAGAQAAEALADAVLTPPTGTLVTADSIGGQVVALDDGRYLACVPIANAPGVWQKLTNKASPAGVPTWRWLDIVAGFPLISAATREEFVPQMADFEKLGGVSFHKGCYPGQEIVARTQYLGKVKRHLYRIAAEQPLVAGAALHSPENPDQACGMVVSGAPSPEGDWAGLAVVQANYAANLRLGALDGPAIEATAVNPA
jgi:folate-binding protein YgfZ